MNKYLLNFSLGSLLIMATIAAQAESSGTITFNGELTDSTCDVDINGQSADGIVNLPTVSVNALTATGETAGRTVFNMNLSNCTVSAAGGHSKVSAFFQPGANVNLATGRLENTDKTGAQNVDLQLLDVNGGFKVINVGNADQINAMEYIDLDANGATVLPYAVEYYANTQTTPGLVQSSVVYNIQYK